MAASATFLAGIQDLDNSTAIGRLLVETLAVPDDFAYHKALLPLDARHDGLAFFLASLSSVLAAGGGIGGGGLLVPIFVLVLRFRPKHAVALSNVMVLGGAVASIVVNSQRRHPRLRKPLIDWDLVLIMEPATMAGAMIGSLFSKVLPSILITVPLVVILLLLGGKSLNHGIKLWHAETTGSVGQKRLKKTSALLGDAAVALFRDGSSPTSEPGTPTALLTLGTSQLFFKIRGLVLCLFGACILTVLRGGGAAPSPIGVQCGSLDFWGLYFVCFPWVLGYGMIVRRRLLKETQDKVDSGYSFDTDEVIWDAGSTVKYAMFSSLAGVLAGLFGVGGGILKGPLMLEMGIPPVVASATAAAMILFTTSAASISFATFGMLDLQYGAVCFGLGIAATFVGQLVTNKFVRGGRESVVVMSIGAVIILSSLFVAFDALTSTPSEHSLGLGGVCS